VVIPSGGATGDGGFRALDGVPSLHQAPKFALITAFPFAECHSMKPLRFEYIAYGPEPTKIGPYRYQFRKLRSCLWRAGSGVLPLGYTRAALFVANEGHTAPSTGRRPLDQALGSR
jgi:hypothetical protein